MADRDYYDILGVGRGVGEEDIRKALGTQIPTFIRRAGKNEYLAENQKKYENYP